MERRTAITTAAAASLTLLAGAAGIAVNSGIVGANGDGNVGKLSPVSPTPAAPATAAPGVTVGDPAVITTSPAPSVRPVAAAPVTRSGASGTGHAGAGHEREDSHEHEGAGEDD